MVHEATIEEQPTGGRRHLISIFTECGDGAMKHPKLLREHARVLGDRPP
jgi:hypothetical protein